jgi:hypothetical protein
LLVAANVIPTLPILVTLMMDAIRSSETSVLATRRNIPEDTILHSHRRENLKCYGGMQIYDKTEEIRVCFRLEGRGFETR